MNHIVRLSNGKAVAHCQIFKSVIDAIKALQHAWPDRDITFHIADERTDKCWS